VKNDPAKPFIFWGGEPQEQGGVGGNVHKGVEERNIGAARRGGEKKGERGGERNIGKGMGTKKSPRAKEALYKGPKSGEKRRRT